jgi:hypothetical protein
MEAENEVEQTAVTNLATDSISKLQIDSLPIFAMTSMDKHVAKYMVATGDASAEAVSASADISNSRCSCLDPL